MPGIQERGLWNYGTCVGSWSKFGVKTDGILCKKSHSNPIATQVKNPSRFLMSSVPGMAISVPGMAISWLPGVRPISHTCSYAQDGCADYAACLSCCSLCFGSWDVDGWTDRQTANVYIYIYVCVCVCVYIYICVCVRVCAFVNVLCTCCSGKFRQDRVKQQTDEIALHFTISSEVKRPKNWSINFMAWNMQHSIDSTSLALLNRQVYSTGFTASFY